MEHDRTVGELLADQGEPVHFFGPVHGDLLPGFRNTSEELSDAAGMAFQFERLLDPAVPDVVAVAFGVGIGPLDQRDHTAVIHGAFPLVVAFFE